MASTIGFAGAGRGAASGFRFCFRWVSPVDSPPESGVTSSASLAGFAGAESGVTSPARLAGFARIRRPRGGRNATPASFK